jgi:hypothetical protein
MASIPSPYHDISIEGICYDSKAICHDCNGKVFSTGGGMSFYHFQTFHLAKNKAHRESVEIRMMEQASDGELEERAAKLHRVLQRRNRR